MFQTVRKIFLIELEPVTSKHRCKVFQECELIIPTPPHHFCFLTEHRKVFFRWKQFGILHVEDAEEKGQVGCSLEGCELKGYVLYWHRVTTKNFQVKFWTGRFLGPVFICNSSNDFRKRKLVSCYGGKHSESKSEYTTWNIELFEVFPWSISFICNELQWNQSPSLFSP